MANLIGSVKSNNSERSVTRTGNKWIKTSVSSYNGDIEVYLWSDGSYRIIVRKLPEYSELKQIEGKFANE